MTKYYLASNEDGFLHYTKVTEKTPGEGGLVIEDLFKGTSTTGISKREAYLTLEQYEEVLEESGGIKEIPIGEYELTKIELLVELQEKKYIHVG
jgi:hypothetical protein